MDVQIAYRFSNDGGIDFVLPHRVAQTQCAKTEVVDASRNSPTPVRDHGTSFGREQLSVRRTSDRQAVVDIGFSLRPYEWTEPCQNGDALA